MLFIPLQYLDSLIKFFIIVSILYLADTILWKMNNSTKVTLKNKVEKKRVWIFLWDFGISSRMLTIEYANWNCPGKLKIWKTVSKNFEPNFNPPVFLWRLKGSMKKLDHVLPNKANQRKARSLSILNFKYLTRNLYLLLTWWAQNSK